MQNMVSTTIFVPVPSQALLDNVLLALVYLRVVMLGQRGLVLLVGVICKTSNSILGDSCFPFYISMNKQRYGLDNYKLKLQLVH